MLGIDKPGINERGGNGADHEVTGQTAITSHAVSHRLLTSGRGLPPIMTVHGDSDQLVPYQHAVRIREALLNGAD
jgi:predicted esterase